MTGDFSELVTTWATCHNWRADGGGIIFLITASFLSDVYRMNFLLYFYNRVFQFM